VGRQWQFDCLQLNGNIVSFGISPGRDSAQSRGSGIESGSVYDSPSNFCIDNLTTVNGNVTARSSSAAAIGTGLGNGSFVDQHMFSGDARLNLRRPNAECFRCYHKCVTTYDLSVLASKASLNHPSHGSLKSILSFKTICRQHLPM
jgi:hypothetical protein